MAQVILVARTASSTLPVSAKIRRFDMVMLIAALSSIKGYRIRWNASGIRQARLYQIFFDSIINRIAAGNKSYFSTGSGSPTRLATLAPLFDFLARAGSV